MSNINGRLHALEQSHNRAPWSGARLFWADGTPADDGPPSTAVPCLEHRDCQVDEGHHERVVRLVWGTQGVGNVTPH